MELASGWKSVWQTKISFKSRNSCPFGFTWPDTDSVTCRMLPSMGSLHTKHCLLAELESGKGWLHEVAQDLQWMGTFKEIPFACPSSRPQWIQAWQILRECPTMEELDQAICSQTYCAGKDCLWHSLLPSAHLSQSWNILACGFADDADTQPATSCAYSCDRCDATFSTRQQLALHAFRLHGVRALECQYVQSEVCPGCLKTFHTSFRVSQHLRYRPNKCWERVFGVRAPGPPANITLPAHLQGVHRLPAIRRHHGPLRPTAPSPWEITSQTKHSTIERRRAGWLCLVESAHRPAVGKILHPSIRRMLKYMVCSGTAHRRAFPQPFLQPLPRPWDSWVSSSAYFYSLDWDGLPCVLWEIWWFLISWQFWKGRTCRF